MCARHRGGWAETIFDWSVEPHLEMDEHIRGTFSCTGFMPNSRTVRESLIGNRRRITFNHLLRQLPIFALTITRKIEAKICVITMVLRLQRHRLTPRLGSYETNMSQLLNSHRAIESRSSGSNINEHSDLIQRRVD
jgi:hypothetical protein